MSDRSPACILVKYNYAELTQAVSPPVKAGQGQPLHPQPPPPPVPPFFFPLFNLTLQFFVWIWSHCISRAVQGWGCTGWGSSYAGRVSAVPVRVLLYRSGFCCTGRGSAVPVGFCFTSRGSAVPVGFCCTGWVLLYRLGSALIVGVLLYRLGSAVPVGFCCIGWVLLC